MLQGLSAREAENHCTKVCSLSLSSMQTICDLHGIMSQDIYGRLKKAEVESAFNIHILFRCALHLSCSTSPVFTRGHELLTHMTGYRAESCDLL